MGKFAAFFLGDAGRLFEENVDAVLEQATRRGEVQIGREQDVNGVASAVTREFERIADRFGNAMIRREGLGAREVGVADGDDSDVRQLAQSLNVPIGDVARAEDADFYWLFHHRDERIEKTENRNAMPRMAMGFSMRCSGRSLPH